MQKIDNGNSKLSIINTASGQESQQMSLDNNTGPSNVNDTADSSKDEDNTPESQVGQFWSLVEHSHQIENFAEEQNPNSSFEAKTSEDSEDSSEAEDTTDNMPGDTTSVKIYDKPPTLVRTGEYLDRYIFRLNNWKTRIERQGASKEEMFDEVIGTIEEDHPLMDKFMTETMKWKDDDEKKKEIQNKGIEIIIQWIRSWLGKSEIANVYKVFMKWINTVREQKEDTLEFLNNWDTQMNKIEA